MVKVVQIGFGLLVAGCGGSSFSAAATDPLSDAGRQEASALDAGAAQADSARPESGPSQVGDSEPAPVCTIATSPMLTSVQGATNAGISFRVTQDLVLTSFVFTGEGMQDTLTLSDAQCNAIASVSVPGTFPPVYAPYMVNVHWPLKAGVLYQLVNSYRNQTAYAVGPTFPYTSGVLTVEQGLVTCPPANEGQVWTAFTDLTFCSSTPGEGAE
jgi:hypothetical protein